MLQRHSMHLIACSATKLTEFVSTHVRVQRTFSISNHRCRLGDGCNMPDGYDDILTFDNIVLKHLSKQQLSKQHT